MNAIVDRDGRIVLAPELGAEPGDEVVIEKRGDEWVMQITKMPAGLVRRGGVLVHAGVATEPIEDAVEKDRQARMDQLSEGIPERLLAETSGPS